MIQGEKINLRPVTRADLDLLKKWTNDVDFTGEFNNFGLKSPEGIEKRFDENGYLGTDRGMLVITTKEGEVIGDISYYCIFYGPGEGNKVPMIGISLHKDQRGKGYGGISFQGLSRPKGGSLHRHREYSRTTRPRKSRF
jgi:RimJ/RimL family protein N-acetyltransferase